MLLLLLLFISSAAIKWGACPSRKGTEEAAEEAGRASPVRAGDSDVRGAPLGADVTGASGHAAVELHR